MIEELLNKIFLNRYLTTSYIGKGAFGKVYIGKNLETSEIFAMKFEKKKDGFKGLLEDEYHKLRYLQNDGIPKVYIFGTTNSHYILIEELLGKNLSELFEMCGKQFSVNTVCLLGIEIVNLIQSIHLKHHLHRDIKPDNFMIGRGAKENKIYLIDFGLARKYWSSSKKTHIPFTEGKKLTGTARYCSINTHLGYEQSRRDDLVSIGYMMILFLNGKLPWQGLKVKNRNEQLQAIADKKTKITNEELCHGHPSELVQYFDYVTQLNFEDKPDYTKCVGILHNVRRKNCDESDLMYDWQKRIKSGLPMKKSGKKEKTEASNIANRTGGSSYNPTVAALTTSNPPEEESLAFSKKKQSDFGRKKTRLTKLANQSTPDKAEDKLKNKKDYKLSVKDIAPEIKETNSSRKVHKFNLDINDKEIQKKPESELQKQSKSSFEQPIKKKSNLKKTKNNISDHKDGVACLCLIF